MKFICSCCGKEHEQWPALVFHKPDPYLDLEEGEKKNNAKISEDFCIIHYPDQTDRFIRCTLTQTVNDHCDDLEYGIWVSLSKESYQNYYDNYDSENHLVEYFGWLSTRIPDYENTLEIPVTVKTRSGNSRPSVIPHNNFDHLFVRDYYNGITKTEAEKRINNMLRITDSSK